MANLVRMIASTLKEVGSGMYFVEDKGKCTDRLIE